MSAPSTFESLLFFIGKGTELNLPDLEKLSAPLSDTFPWPIW